MTQQWRLPSGGIVDRSRTVHFEYDGVNYAGFAGDTLASALLANGVHLVGRSFKYHRARGIYTAGVEEPNALVQLARGARNEPNARAPTVELYDGLVASSQNCWPSVKLDAGAIANVLSRFLPAGFYYKTFMWPSAPRWWLRYEHVIRKAAGLGRAPDVDDTDRYEHQYAHCDVLVIGGGPAGIAAARIAADAGARVIVCQQSPMFGSKLHAADEIIEGEPASAWLASATAALEGTAEVTLLSRTNAFGYYDDNLVAALERLTDHLAQPPEHLPRMRLWLVRAKAVVLATGAIERGIAYINNDLPGTMLANAVHTYVTRYAVRPGSRAVVFTNNDGAYRTAFAMHAAGIQIAALIDARDEAAIDASQVRRARDAGLALWPGSMIVRASGRHRVNRVEVAARSGTARRTLDCDIVALSGGYSPAVHLFSHARGTVKYDERIAAFVPDQSPLPILPAGAVQGSCTAMDAIAQARVAARRALDIANGRSPASSVSLRDPAVMRVDPLWSTVAASDTGKAFIDLQDDVTVSDVALAAREGYDAVEHLKRYTTLGMGPDQGKTSNVVGLALLARESGAAIAQVGTTTFRPPYVPITLGALPGHAHGTHVEPTRYTPMHEWHANAGARFVNTGLWKRAHSYCRAGESEDDAAIREARNVRENVGIVDVSTLGKIELQGSDVAEFLNRIYTNRWDTLQVGRCRYGVMLREDGIVRDDGTTSRLDDTHYLMTTTTANAVAVMQSIERLLQVDWPELDVYATSVTEQWAAAALSGPRSRDVLATLVDIDLSNAAIPFLAVTTCGLRVADGVVPARLFRMSYSGELAYEIHVPSTHGLAMWQSVIEAGRDLSLMPYGTEAMNTLRVEKGHVVIGAEIDGRTTARDLGMEKLVSSAKWCIGKPLLARAALNTPDRWQLVGLTALDGAVVPRGGKLVDEQRPAPRHSMLGHVTSWCYSPHVQAWIGLGLLSGGRERHGQTLWAVSPLADARVRVRVGPPCAVDPSGERLRS